MKSPWKSPSGEGVLAGIQPEMVPVVWLQVLLLIFDTFPLPSNQTTQGN